jgi:hypothetical protein
MELKRLAARSFTATLMIVMVMLSLAQPAAAAPPTVRGFDVGDRFGCAVMTTHHVECWGFGDDGQLGDGKELLSYTPVRVHLT